MLKITCHCGEAIELQGSLGLYEAECGKCKDIYKVTHVKERDAAVGEAPLGPDLTTIKGLPPDNDGGLPVPGKEPYKK